LVIAEIGVLLQRLSDTSYIAMAENPKAPGKKGLLDAVALCVLVLEKEDDRLSHGQASSDLSTHFSPPLIFL
jgi:hypothetical protein